MATPASADRELATITHHSNDLRLAIQSNLDDLSHRLAASSPPILTQDNVAEVTNEAVDAPKRATKLVCFIVTKIAGDPRCYHALVEVLEEADATFYGNILGKLSETFANPPPGTPPAGNGTGSGEKLGCATAAGCAKKGEIEIILGKEDLATVLKLLTPVASKWQQIAPHLKPSLADGAVGEIDSDNRGKSRDCLREMIRKWLQRVKPCRPSWQRLRSAIEDSAIDESESIVEKIDNIILQKAQAKS